MNKKGTFYFLSKILLRSFLLAALFLNLSCQTLQYHEPLLLSQEEISSMTVTDEHGGVRPISAGKIRDCVTMKSAGIGQCAVIVCREDKTQTTGFSCEYHVPITPVTKNLNFNRSVLSSNKDKSVQSQIKVMVEQFDKGQFSELEKFCGLDTVVCYYKAKPYPLSKKPSSANLSTLIHKESVTTKNDESLEISVFKD